MECLISKVMTNFSIYQTSRMKFKEKKFWHKENSLWNRSRCTKNNKSLDSIMCLLGWMTMKNFAKVSRLMNLRLKLMPNTTCKNLKISYHFLFNTEIQLISILLPRVTLSTISKILIKSSHLKTHKEKDTIQIL